jgi:hypothetical protein
MAHAPKLDMDEILPEFGVSRREVDAEIKRRLALPGKSYTSAEVREHFRRLSTEAAANHTKKSRANDR